MTDHDKNSEHHGSYRLEDPNASTERSSSVSESGSSRDAGFSVSSFQQEDDVMVIEFHKHRNKTLRCGRCLLYLGLLIFGLNSCVIIMNIVLMFVTNHNADK